MPLPIIQTPRYETTLPSNGKKIQYRPYLVKEEKMLMIALESSDSKQIMNAVKDTIAACTFNKVDPNEMPIFDLEYMFLRLRAKSVGEISKLSLRCEKCEKNTKVDVNLDEIKIDTTNLPSSTIPLTDKIGVSMIWPKVDLISQYSQADGAAVNQANMAFDIIIGCIESVYDENGVYPTAEQTKADVTQFVESLNQDQFKKIQAFIEAMPKLEHNIEFNCAHCKEKNSLLLKGIQSFF